MEFHTTMNDYDNFYIIYFVNFKKNALVFRLMNFIYQLKEIIK